MTSTNDRINCEEVEEEMESRVGSDFYCFSHDHGYEEDAAGVLTTRPLHVLGIAVAINLMLWA